MSQNQQSLAKQVPVSNGTEHRDCHFTSSQAREVVIPNKMLALNLSRNKVGCFVLKKKTNKHESNDLVSEFL